MIFHILKHIEFCAKEFLQEISLHYFIYQKFPLETTCRNWFRCYKNNNFDIEDKECSGAPQKFEKNSLKMFEGVGIKSKARVQDITKSFCTITRLGHILSDNNCKTGENLKVLK